MKKFIICAILSVGLLSGCTFTKNEDIIVNINDLAITRAQFEKAVDKEIDNSMFKAFGGSANFIKDDNNLMYLVYKHKAIGELISKTLLDNEIEKRGIKVTDEDVKNEMKIIIDKVGSKEELNRTLRERGVSNDSFIKDVKTQVKMKKLVDTIEKVNITDSDAEKYYNENKEKFKHGEQVRASHILISADVLQIIKELKAKNKDLTPEELNVKVEQQLASQKEKAEKILKEVQANPNKFAQIASKVSDDKVSGERGGELGFFAKESMVPEFSEAAFAMKPDTISQTLVKSPYGYHIIKVTDRVEAGSTPFAKVKEDIKYLLETQRKLQIIKDFTDSLVNSAKIEYVDKSFEPAYIQKQTEKLMQESKKVDKKDK